jgi:hypothetical protein
LVKVPKETTKRLNLAEKTVEPSLDLVVNWVVEDEVLLSIDLSEMEHLEDPFLLVNLVIFLDPQSMRTHSKFSLGDLKSMHPISKCVMGSNNESIPNNHEVLSIEVHLWM